MDTAGEATRVPPAGYPAGRGKRNFLPHTISDVLQESQGLLKTDYSISAVVLVP